jgi:hypothetical protein
MRAFLGEVRRRQIHDDALAGQPQADRGQGAAHPLPALRNRLVRQADNREGGSSARQLHLHVHPQHIDTLESDSSDAGDHAGKRLLRWQTARIMPRAVAPFNNRG